MEKEALSAQEIKDIAKLGGISARELINPKSRNFKDLGILLDDSLTEDSAVRLLTENPKIMYRPVIIADNRMLLGFNEQKFASFFGKTS